MAAIKIGLCSEGSIGQCVAIWHGESAKQICSHLNESQHCQKAFNGKLCFETLCSILQFWMWTKILQSLEFMMAMEVCVKLILAGTFFLEGLFLCLVN
jgi:hypothetical protein